MLPIEINNGFIPPQDVSVEEGVLSAMLLEKDGLRAALSLLRHHEIFYMEAHQEIFKAAKELSEEWKPVDLLTITAKLRANGMLEKVGGAYFITKLTTKVNSAINIEHHCSILIELWMRRLLIMVSAKNMKSAYDQSEDIFDLMAKAMGQINKIQDALLVRKPETMGEVVKEALAEIQEAVNHGGIPGVQTGVGPLDKVTGGWMKRKLIILAARPGMGKTTLILSAARSAALDFNEPGLFISGEMGRTELVKKMMSAESGIEYSRIERGKLEDGRLEHLLNSISKLITDKILFDDESKTIQAVIAKAINAKASRGIKWIVIDYLQLLDNPLIKGNREQEVSSITRALKRLAKELDIPVIALSQLSREVDKRPDKRPQLSDLRESGSIEQDADVVVFLFRPHYYGITGENGESLEQVMEFIIAKNRGGNVGVEVAKCDMAKNKFYYMDEVMDDFNKAPQYNPNKFTEPDKHETPPW